MNANLAQLIFFVVVVVLIAVVITIAARTGAARRARIDDGDVVISDQTNTLAVMGFVFAFIGSIPGIVLSHVALAQIKRTHERGWGLAVAGLWIGYAGLAVSVGLVVALTIAFAAQMH